MDDLLSLVYLFNFTFVFSFETVSCSVAQGGLKLKVLLPQLPEYRVGFRRLVGSGNPLTFSLSSRHQGHHPRGCVLARLCFSFDTVSFRSSWSLPTPLVAQSQAHVLPDQDAGL